MRVKRTPTKGNEEIGRKKSVCFDCGRAIGFAIEKEDEVQVPVCMSCVSALAVEQMSAMFCLLAEETAKKCRMEDPLTGEVKSILNGLVCKKCGRPQYFRMETGEIQCLDGHKGEGVEYGTWSVQFKRRGGK